MKQFNNVRRVLGLWLVAAAVAMTGSCVTTDDTLGGNLVPENQQMKAGYMQLPLSATSPKKYVESRLFITDSIKSSNLETGYMGSEMHDTLGLRTAGFLSQIISYYVAEEGYFGYKPVFDSAQLAVSITSYGKDTLTEQRFGIYEILSNDYITKKPLAEGASERDSTFYVSFDPLDPNGDGSAAPVYDPAKCLFTFTLGGENGPSTEAVTLAPTKEGLAYVRRLMLMEGRYKDDYSIYSGDSLKQWVEEFRGLYIRPESPVTEPGKGSIYATDLTATALTVFGRNHSEEDPSLIKDTIAMAYYLYLELNEEMWGTGNLSVNTVGHDYSLAASPAAVDPADAVESNTERPENPRLYVEGMAGVVSELRFTEDFFNDLYAAIERENAQSGKEFRSLAFSQVEMMLYFPDSRYDWNGIDPSDADRLIWDMNAAPERLGLYTDYKSLTAITDYNYLYEANYGTELDYGGYVNRSRGCYVMNITGYVQNVWNSYIDEREAAAKEGRAIDIDKVKNRTFYLGLEAYSLYTSGAVVLQGGATGEGDAVRNSAPIRLNITYNMIK